MPAANPTSTRGGARHMRPRSRKSSLPKPGKVDGAAVLGVALLLTVGLIALFSASYVTAMNKFDDGLFFIKRQSFFAVVGFIAMLFISEFDYHNFSRFRNGLIIKALIVVSVIFLLAIKIPGVGVNANGATRWINLPVVGQFQPSELAKLTIIIAFSHYAVQMGDGIRRVRNVLPFFVALVAVAGLLYLEPHMSATVIIFGIGLAILLVAGMRIWYFIPLGILGGAAAYWYISTQGYANARIVAWINPFDPEVFRNKGWQGANSQTAIGSGGFWGLGLGQGRQKHLYLPEPQNDFVFASWCEEMGFIGALLVVLLFAYLIYRCYFIAFHAPDKLGCLIGTGIATKLAIQTLVNMFVVTGIFPVTGASLPFFSYGGTALLMQLGEMGIMLNISRRIRPSDKQKG